MPYGVLRSYCVYKRMSDSNFECVCALLYLFAECLHGCLSECSPGLPIMTFLKSCIDFLTHLLVTPLLDFGRIDQAPLSFQVANHAGSHAVAPYPKIDPNSCRYPKLEALGYRHCNGDSRKCWLKKPYGYGPEWDIHTDYENFVPTGVVREVGQVCSCK